MMIEKLEHLINEQGSILGNSFDGGCEVNEYIRKTQSKVYILYVKGAEVIEVALSDILFYPESQFLQLLKYKQEARVIMAHQTMYNDGERQYHAMRLSLIQSDEQRLAYLLDNVMM